MLCSIFLQSEKMIDCLFDDRANKASNLLFIKLFKNIIAHITNHIEHVDLEGLKSAIRSFLLSPATMHFLTILCRIYLFFKNLEKIFCQL